MIDIVVHPTTQKSLDVLSSDLPQSILISGLKGVGNLTLARQLAGKELVALLQPQNTTGQPDSESGTIGVEAIRRLYEQTRAKQSTRHIIIIDDADRMSHSAQSAFLKLLEEPNNKIHFILTSHNPQKLLPTIRSRVQTTVLQPLSFQQSADFIKALDVHDPVKQKQLQFIAEGLPAELTRLTQDELYFQSRAKIMSDARDLLQADIYKKMLIIQSYRSDRGAAAELIESALQILRRSISAKPHHSLVVQLDNLLDIQNRLETNGNVQLQLARFVL